MKHYQRLTQTERQLIAQWNTQGVSRKEIGRRLKRETSTISRELTRNCFKKDIYEPLHAHGKAKARLMQRAYGKHPLKNPQVYVYVLERLRWGWSPEQIAGRLKLKYPDDSSWHICHEAIYQFIYHKDNDHQRWWEYLRRKQKRRRQKLGRKTHRLRIPDRVSIHLRPGVVDQRTEFGHWEGDTLVGKGRLSGLHTAYERFASLIRFERMNQLTAQVSEAAQRKIYQPLPQHARKTTTLDNGSEHAHHTQLKSLITTYFADPYSAYQRGGNENANLWVRYYFPKGTDFNTVSDEELKAVEWELNNRPRKRLQYRTPMEVFTEQVHTKGCTST